ncbi:MAG: diguanylate cyclase response regulator [Deltaproteobacteria bacterium HGW-Deltaproteobacteria-8]|jgi:diguanylate cyclase (GGDEF)-like protein|nr:MAG: diguanylate cyclase response regulator [Deltaproteobacteria bacterium HGW-Deltaproteobacteria-8]
MSRVLVVEDSRTFSSLLSRRITEEMGHEVVVANSKATAKKILAEGTNFFVALLDLNLPDAPNGEVVDMVLAHSIPSIVFTGEMDDKLRDQFWAKHIVDYILKQNMDNVAYMLSLVERLHRNPAIKVLVVDDSKNTRYVVGELLRAHRYQVLEAGSGQEALAVLAKHPDTRLVIVDYNMPGMDGAELVRTIRHDHAKDQLAIIGLSGTGDAGLTVKFIKSGANDFLHMPFLTEEFYTRVTQNIELLEYIAQIKELAEKDYLTRLYNRRYVFSAGPKLMATQTRRGQGVVLAMIDVDHFKNINDTHGHAAGDAVLRQMAALLAARFRVSDIVSRFGGEEFCVLATDMNPADAGGIFEDLRHCFETSPVSFGDKSIRYTVSIGLCTSPLDGLEAMIKAADDALYVSKNDGRNRVTVA